MKYTIEQEPITGQVSNDKFTLDVSFAGSPGLSAYQQWLAEGNTGTWADFYESLRGPTGFVDPSLQTLHDDTIIAKDIAVNSATSADADAIATAADRVQTGLDATATAADRVQTDLDTIATAADRVQTGLDAEQTALDAEATAADRVQTGLDAEATALDRIATGEDRVQTGLDREATGEDRVQTGLDRVAVAADLEQTDLDTVATAADRVQTGLDRIQTGADKTQTGLDAAATGADRTQTELDATATASDRVQTGLDAQATAADRVVTGQDKLATNADAAATAADLVQTGLDRIAVAADLVQTDLDTIATAADRVQTGLDRIATGEDRVATNADALSTSQDVIATAADRIAVAADLVQTDLDTIATAADRVQTGADRTQTGLDRQATAADAIATDADSTQTGLDRIATGADRTQTGIDATNAGTARDKAEQWAENPTDVAVEIGQYSAKHWAAKAADIAASSDISAHETTYNHPGYNAHVASTANPHNVTAAQAGAEPSFSKNSAFNKDFGTTAGTVAQGDDVRLSNDRLPLVHGSDKHSESYEPANANIQSHISSTTNPHSVTKTQVGLSNVDNTSDTDKPVSTAQQTALDLKADKPTDDIHLLGQPGELGFGCATAKKEHWTKAGCVPLPGHDQIAHDNYGNYLHLASGAILVFIPKHYFKIEGNTFSYSDVPATGYVIDRSFINAGAEIDGVFVSKYGGTNNNGIFSSQPGLDPLSTNSAHNPISQLNGTPANNYGGLYAAVKTMSADAVLTPVFVYSMLARMAKAHGEAASSTSVCAYIDVDPKMPKGNLLSALRDANDSSVTYVGSGYSACGLTGSGTPFAKTTHNGQACGIADLNGNMWEVASGFIRYDSTGFLILKESADLTAITSDSTTTGSGGAYDSDLYDAIDISDLISSNAGWIDLGNGSNQVFGFSATRTDAAYKRTALGIPLADGVSGSGTTEFGNDGIYRYLVNEMACHCGGSWQNSSHAGVFAMGLYDSRTSFSGGGSGGRASILV